MGFDQGFVRIVFQFGRPSILSSCYIASDTKRCQFIRPTLLLPLSYSVVHGSVLWIKLSISRLPMPHQTRQLCDG